MKAWRQESLGWLGTQRSPTAGPQSAGEISRMQVMKGRVDHRLKLWRGEGDQSRDRFAFYKNHSAAVKTYRS